TSLSALALTDSPCNAVAAARDQVQSPKSVPHSLSPLAGMCPPVKMNHFAVYKGSRLQELDQVHDFRNLGQSVERTQFLQEIVRLCLVHWSVHHTRGNGVETDAVSRKLNR